MYGWWTKSGKHQFVFCGVIKMFKHPKWNSPINHPLYETLTPDLTLEHCNFLHVIFIYFACIYHERPTYPVLRFALLPAPFTLTFLHPTLDGSCQNPPVSVRSIRTDGVIFATAETKDDLEWCLKQAARSDGNYECLPGFAYVYLYTICKQAGRPSGPLLLGTGVYMGIHHPCLGISGGL